MMGLLMEMIVKTTTCVSKKSYMWIDFLNPKISYHTQHKNAFLYTKRKIQ
jgi:hypothetical protein